LKLRKRVDIAGYGVYIPIYKLSLREIRRVWRGSGGGAFDGEKAVAAVDEDSVTMAVEASRVALKMAGCVKLGAIFVGSESKPYAVKPSGTIVAQALGVRDTLAADLEFACKAGTEGIQALIGLISSGMVEAGLAIGSDTAQGRPADDLEYTAASGAAAFVLTGNEGQNVATFESTYSYVTDTPDFWRRDGERYPKHRHRFTGDPSYFHHVETVGRELLRETGYKPSDFKYAVFHQPNVKFPLDVGGRLGFTKEQILPGIIHAEVGNIYAGSMLLGLAALLDISMPGDKLLAVSYGSGAGSDGFVLSILDGIVEKREKGVKVRDILKRKKYVDYGLYLKMRDMIRM